MRDLVLATFKEPAQTYQAFSDIKVDSVNSAYTVYQMAVVEKEDDRIIVKDSFDSGIDTTDDTWKGGLIGTVVGILGGPLGILLGGAAGALIGNTIDAGDAADNSSLLLAISDDLSSGQTGLVILVDEPGPKPLDLRLNQYKCKIYRWDADEVEAEIEHAQQVQADLQREARQKLRDQKRQQLKENFQAKKEEIKNKISDALN